MSERIVIKIKTLRTYKDTYILNSERTCRSQTPSYVKEKQFRVQSIQSKLERTISAIVFNNNLSIQKKIQRNADIPYTTVYIVYRENQSKSCAGIIDICENETKQWCQWWNPFWLPKKGFCARLCQAHRD